MPIAVNCPTCKKSLGIPDQQRGKPVRCPYCKGIFTAGAAPEAAKPPTTKPPVPSAAKSAAPPKPPALPAKKSEAITSRSSKPAPRPRPAAADSARDLPQPRRPRATEDDRRPRSRKQASTSRAPLWIGLGAGGGVVTLGLLFASVWWLTRTPAPQVAQNNVPQVVPNNEQQVAQDNAPQVPQINVPVEQTPVPPMKEPIAVKEEPKPEFKNPEPIKPTVIEPRPNPITPVKPVPPVTPTTPIATSPGPVPAQIDPEMTRKVKKATVYLKVTLPSGQKVEGSGFMGIEPGLIFTNAHVLGMLAPGTSAPKQVEVVFNSGEPDERILSGKLLGADRDNDLAILRVDAGASLPPPLTVDVAANLTEIQKVYIFGFPFGASLGKNITVSESSVSSLRKDTAGLITQVQVNGGMHQGNSGGPVVDARGAVVGVAVAIIKGTQINFAVPGEKVQNLLNGYVAEVHSSERFDMDGQTYLPVELACLDPLQRIRDVKLDVWTGPTGRPRPGSTTRPASMAGDGPRQQVQLKYAGGRGLADVPLPVVGPGQVVWLQPVVTNASGTPHWGQAVVFKSGDLPPLLREPANFQLNFSTAPERTVKLQNISKLQLRRADKQAIITDTLEFQALEKPQSNDKGGMFQLYLGPTRYVTEMDGKSAERNPSIMPLLRDRPFNFVVSDNGRLMTRGVPSPTDRMPLLVQQDFEDVVNQVSNAFEATCISLPGRVLAPQETWQARLPMLMAMGKRAEVVDMLLTCRYEGSRKHGGRNLAYVKLTGNIEPRNASKDAFLSGQVTGHAHFDLDQGYMADASVQVESEYDHPDLNASVIFEYTLTRVPGNIANIVVRPPTTTGTPVARGKLLKTYTAALTPQDPSNFPGKTGCAYKLYPVQLVAGTTYVIELRKVSINDPFLILVGANNTILARDDDGAGNLNSRIIYQAQQTGAFGIVATTLTAGDLGGFTLQVFDASKNGG